MKAACTFILIFLLTASSPLEYAARSQARNDVVEVPFDFYRNAIVVQVKVNEKGFYNMLLDTGTNPSVVDLKAAKEIGLKVASAGHQGDGGGTSTNLAYETRLPLVQLGDLTARNIAALAIDLSRPSEALGKPIHGVLGDSF